MKTPCIGCRKLIPVGSGGRCHACKNPARRLRSTAAWTKRSKEVRASGVCAGCGAKGVPLEAHHLVQAARHPEQTLTGPVISLCHSCHQKATNAHR